MILVLFIGRQTRQTNDGRGRTALIVVVVSLLIGGITQRALSAFTTSVQRKHNEME